MENLRVLDEMPEFSCRGQAPEWERLRVDGLVRKPLALTLRGLQRFPQDRMAGDFVCEEGWIAPSQVWEGVPVREVLLNAGPLPEAKYVAFSAGGFTIGLPLEEALAPNLMLALHLNEEPLPPVHGGPCRLVVPEKECFTSIKWIERIELTDYRPEDTARDIALRRINKDL